LRERERNPEHFRSIKDKVDSKTQKLAEYTSAYNSDFVKAAVEYRPEYVKIEGSTVSGDAPQWMQVPGVKVNRISSMQLKTLLNTSASINKDAVDPRLLGLFQVCGGAHPTQPMMVNPRAKNSSLAWLRGAAEARVSKYMVENVFLRGGTAGTHILRWRATRCPWSTQS
jgi:hypothetical protein